jgi:hypothetical protein
LSLDAGPRLDAGGEGEGEGEGEACADAIGHDEDGDGVDDACDNCPADANAGQEDVGEVNAGGAADGVGDACDPRPAAGGDSIAFFDGFGAALSGWSVYEGVWSVQNDRLVQADIYDVNLIERTDLQDGDVLVDTTFEITAFGSNGNAAVVLRMDALDYGWACAVRHDNNGTTAVRHYYLEANNTFTFEDTFDVAPAVLNTPYRITGDGFETITRCGMGSGRTNVNAAWNTSGAVGLRAKRMAADFHYFLVYGLGGALP